MILGGRDWVMADPIRAYLVSKGAIYLGIGISWLVLPSRGRELGIEWFPGLTSPLVAAMWLLGGAAAVATGFWGRHRRVGFGGLQSVAFFIALVFLVSAAMGVLPDDIALTGNPRSIVTTISYLGFWVSAVVVAQIKPQPVISPPASTGEVAIRHDT